MWKDLKLLRMGLLVFFNLFFMLCILCVNVYAQETIKINRTTLSFNKIIYADSTTGNDTTGTGTAQKPYKTIQKAQSQVSSGDAVVLKGTFDVGKSYSFKSGVSFIGYELNTTIIGTDIWYGNSSFYRMVFDYAKRDETWTIGGTVNIYNVVIKNQYSSNGSIELFNTYTGNMWNCLVANGNWNSLYWSSMNGNFKNNAISKTYNWSPFTLQGVTYDSTFRITSGGWQNTGTGTNPDGTRASIGVYGGDFAWGWVDPNIPPKVPDYNVTTQENTAVSGKVEGTDSNGDTLAYTTKSPPGNGDLNLSSDGSWIYTPKSDFTGTDQFVIQVSDGKGGIANSTVTITVNHINRAPQIDLIENKVTEEGKTLGFTVTASDPDGDTISLAAKGLPEGATLDPLTKTFSWTPDYNQAGNYTVNFTVTDDSLTSGQDVIITVNNVETWLTKPNMSTMRSSVTSVALDDSLYVIGGINATGSLNTLEQFCPSTNTWVSRASMPTARQSAGAAVVNGKFYVIGGKSGISVVNVVEEYDPESDTWTTKSPMPTARFGLSTVSVNGKIYAIGGYTGTNYLSTVEEYDPETDTWTKKASMSVRRTTMGADVINGKIYVVCGFNGTYLNMLEEYDPLTNIWNTKANIPTARRGAGAAAVNGKLLVAGGYNGTDLNVLEEFDLVANTWTVKENMPTARGWVGIAMLNNEIYISGGNSSNASYLNILEVYAP